MSQTKGKKMSKSNEAKLPVVGNNSKQEEPVIIVEGNSFAVRIEVDFSLYEYPRTQLTDEFIKAIKERKLPVPRRRYSKKHLLPVFWITDFDVVNSGLVCGYTAIGYNAADNSFCYGTFTSARFVEQGVDLGLFRDYSYPSVFHIYEVYLWYIYSFVSLDIQRAITKKIIREIKKNIASLQRWYNEEVLKGAKLSDVYLAKYIRQDIGGNLYKGHIHVFVGNKALNVIKILESYLMKYELYLEYIEERWETFSSPKNEIPKGVSIERQEDKEVRIQDGNIIVGKQVKNSDFANALLCLYKHKAPSYEHEKETKRGTLHKYLKVNFQTIKAGALEFIRKHHPNIFFDGSNKEKKIACIRTEISRAEKRGAVYTNDNILEIYKVLREFDQQKKPTQTSQPSN